MLRRVQRVLSSVTRLELRGRTVKIVPSAPNPAPQLSTQVDDLDWIAHAPPMRPSPKRLAADKALLLTKLKEPPAARRRIAMQPHPMIGALATAGTLIGVATGTNVATTGLPTPVKDLASSMQVFLGGGDELQASDSPNSRETIIWLGFPRR